jgi:hypothetical protein
VVTQVNGRQLALLVRDRERDDQVLHQTGLWEDVLVACVQTGERERIAFFCVHVCVCVSALFSVCL